MLTTILVIALIFWLFASYAPVRTYGDVRGPFIRGGPYLGNGVTLVIIVLVVLALTGRL
jgi:hypothetical protein